MHSYLIVIFNESVFDTPTYKTLVKMFTAHPHSATLYVWDNSPLAQHPKGLVSEIEQVELVYCHSRFNEHLSVVYNKIMALAFECDSDYMTLLDQDSHISSNFKQSIDDAPNQYLLVPKVCSDKTGQIISPRYQQYNYLFNQCAIDYLDPQISPGELKSEHVFAVGSGMTISKSLWLTGVRFQETLSFYGVDTEFCSDYAKRNEHFVLLASTIKHNASNEHDEGYEKFKWRLTKYYEHWLYQLIKYVGVPSSFASFYVRLSLKYMLLKNKTKRFLR
ncbi:hypothetical protein JQC92_08680 [Shewanella sp. 202IG2-18]|uniref:hypothetical protein n=1 Tax=Parashewanella hymeniacidonis TaxID=2807618 RepID=UPI001961881C|nr:hypothetical protein [Parashewanella hymeniacidonis]MBM7072102.1 hypothetical protein [Parashewanella hymeniacidonis]